MTGLSARQFQLVDRGEIRVGAYADVVVFDAATIRDTATFELPKVQAVGRRLRAGERPCRLRSGEPAPARNGRFLARQPRQGTNPDR